MSIYQTLVDFYGYYMGPDFDSFFSFSFLSFSSFSLSMSLSCFIFLDDQYKIGMLIIKEELLKISLAPMRSVNYLKESKEWRMQFLA